LDGWDDGSTEGFMNGWIEGCDVGAINVGLIVG
jgi:hypothetical protein